MPSKITLADVLPPIWRALEIQPTEQMRVINRATFGKILKTTGTVVSPSVVQRMWETLRASDYASTVPMNASILHLDVQEIRRYLIVLGVVNLNTHTTHTDCPAPQEALR